MLFWSTKKSRAIRLASVIDFELSCGNDYKQVEHPIRRSFFSRGIDKIIKVLHKHNRIDIDACRKLKNDGGCQEEIEIK